MLDKPTSAADKKKALAQLMKFYGDREWRLDHLYYVQDETGTKVLYKRRKAQRAYCENQWVLDIIAKARQLGYCLSPETRVLTADLRWITLDEIKPGQQIMTVDEFPEGNRIPRKLRAGVVEKKWEVFEDAFEIEFETGLKIVATGHHAFLSQRRGGVEPIWKIIGKMRVGDVIRAVTDAWDDPTPEDGWFGGLLDGEGSMRWKPAGGFEIGISQVPGLVLDAARQYLKDNHFSFREEIDTRKKGERSKLGNKPVHKLVLHRTGEVMRLLGKCRPKRFAELWWPGRRLPGDGNSWVKIIAIRAVGKRRMIDLQTSGKTFIAEGLVSHNSTHIAIEITDFCVFNRDKSAAIIDYKLEDAKKKLEKIAFAYHSLPEILKRRCFLLKENEDELRWSNGSSCVVGTTHRGGTNQFLHISEFGKIAAEKPETARDIVTGALQTIAPGQIIKVESTAHGTSGRFYDMVERAKAKLASGTPLSVLDFKLHFYGWMYRDDYRLPVNMVTITQEVIEYFKELRELYGITVDGEQMAWYQHKLTDLGWDDAKEEYPSHLGECFANSLEGAFFKKELSKARADKRIGFPVPYDPTRRVHTAWDKGMNEKSDRNAIWWFQHDGVRFRWIDFYENAGEGIPHYAGVVEDKRIARKFIYGTHYGPHDLNQRVWANTSPTPKTMKDIAKECGIDFKIVDRVEDKEISIEAARRAIATSFFCSEYCDLGVNALDNYRKTWNKVIADWTTTPLHNRYSNGADALQCGAMGIQPEKVERETRRDRGQRKGTHWSS